MTVPSGIGAIDDDIASPRFFTASGERLGRFILEGTRVTGNQLFVLSLRNDTGGAVSRASYPIIWYLAAHTKAPRIVIGEVGNPWLAGMLGELGMTSDGLDNMACDTETVRAAAAHAARAQGWILRGDLPAPGRGTLVVPSRDQFADQDQQGKPAPDVNSFEFDIAFFLGEEEQITGPIGLAVMGSPRAPLSAGAVAAVVARLNAMPAAERQQLRIGLFSDATQEEIERLLTQRGAEVLTAWSVSSGEDEERGSFLMPLEDVFTITGRTVVTGRLERGIIRVGEEIEIIGIREEATTTVTGVEMFRKFLASGSA